MDIIKFITKSISSNRTIRRDSMAFNKGNLIGFSIFDVAYYCGKCGRYVPKKFLEVNGVKVEVLDENTMTRNARGSLLHKKCHHKLRPNPRNKHGKRFSEEGLEREAFLRRRSERYLSSTQILLAAV